MFNFSGSEIVFLLVMGLVVLGPDRLPDAMRRAGKAYAEFKKMSTGFQTEMRSALDEPLRELRETADLAKSAAMFDLNNPFAKSNTAAAEAIKEVPATTASAEASSLQNEAPVPEPIRSPGPAFGSAAPRPTHTTRVVAERSSQIDDPFAPPSGSPGSAPFAPPEVDATMNLDLPHPPADSQQVPSE